MNWKSFSTLAVTIIIVVALAYGSSLTVGLLSDDILLYEGVSKLLFEGASKLPVGRALQQSFSPLGGNFFRPLPLWWWGISCCIWGENISGYHLENVIVHILNSLLVGFLAFRIFRSRIAAWVSSILFAAFPLHPEVVTWLAGRYDLLSVLWSLVALILWMEWRYNGGALRYWFVHICMVLALLSKESVFTLPFLIIGLEWICHDDFKQRSLRKLWWLPGIILWISIFTWRWLIVRGIGDYPHPNKQLSWWVIELDRLVDHLKHSLPYFLSPLHQELISYRIAVLVATTTVILFFLIVLIFKRVRHDQVKRIGGSALGLFIVIGPILPILYIGPDLEGSRLLYFPAVFAALFIAGVMANLWVISKKWKYIVGVIVGIWTVGFIGLSRYHVSFWNEATTKAEQVLESLLFKIESQPDIKELHIINGLIHHHGAYVFYCGLDKALKLCVGKRDVTINYISSYYRDIYIDHNPTKVFLDQVPRDSLGKSVSYVMWDYVNMCYKDVSGRLSRAIAIRDSGGYSTPPKWYSKEGGAFAEWSMQNLQEYSDTGFYRPTGNIPFIHSPKIELIPQLIDSIKLSATVQTKRGQHSSQLVDLSWESEEFGPSPPEFTRRVVLPADGTAHEVCFPMACDAFWVVQDTITSITFSFPGLSNPIQLHSVECYGPGEVVSINSQ